MTLPLAKYVLDTNVLIHAFHDARANEELQRFHVLFAPFEYLSSVVAQELLAGAKAATDRQAVERNVIRIYARRRRIVTPSARAWEESGNVLGRFAREDGLELAGITKAFGNDVLIACSCREAGLILVTDNERDFARIRRFVRFRYAAPWPRVATV